MSPTGRCTTSTGSMPSASNAGASILSIGATLTSTDSHVSTTLMLSLSRASNPISASTAVTPGQCRKAAAWFATKSSASRRRIPRRRIRKNCGELSTSIPTPASGWPFSPTISHCQPLSHTTLQGSLVGRTVLQVDQDELAHQELFRSRAKRCVHYMQVWCAIAICTLLLIIKKQLGLKASMHTILTVLSINVF